MKNHKTLFIHCFICFLFLVLGSTQAKASSFAANMIGIDNIVFEITGDLSLGLLGYGMTSVDAEDDFQKGHSSDEFGGGDLYSTVSLSHAGGDAEIITDPLSNNPGFTNLTSMGVSSAALSDGINLFANAYSFADFGFLIDGGELGGMITITADYNSNSLLETDLPGDLAYFYAFAEMGLWNFDAGDEDFQDFEWVNQISGFDEFGENRSGNFSISMGFDSYDVGEFWIGMESEVFTQGEPIPEPIPEPSTLLLFGFGILGISRLSRRKKK